MSPETKPNAASLPSVHELWKELALRRTELETLVQEGKETGDLSVAQDALEELQLKTRYFEELLQERESLFREVLGKNFLGAAEWREGLGVEVGRPPPIPEYITKELLESKCPLLRGELIKDSHILLLMPKTLEGRPFTPLALAQLCKSRGQPGVFTFNGNSEWEQRPWAHEAQASMEWILIPKEDPSEYMLPDQCHFRNKTLEQQLQVYREEYSQNYEHASALQVIAMVLLKFAVHKQSLLLSCTLRTKQSTDEGSVKVGLFFDSPGLGVQVFRGTEGGALNGFALVRKESEAR